MEGLCACLQLPPPNLADAAWPPPCSFLLNTTFCWVGAPFRSSGVSPEAVQWLWSGQFPRPGFHLLRAPSRRQHPTHPTQGPLSGCPPPCPGSPGASLCVPSLTLTLGTGRGAVLSQAPLSARIPELAGESELPGRPWGLGPSTGSTSGRVAEPLASSASSSPPSLRPFLSPLAGGPAKRRGGSSTLSTRPFPAEAEGGDASWG